MYCDQSSTFHGDAFKHLYGLVECLDTISMKWIAYLNIEIDHMAFESKGQHIWARYKDQATFKVSFVTRIIYHIKAMAKVKL